jgi:hypothetical protein
MVQPLAAGGEASDGGIVCARYFSSHKCHAKISIKLNTEFDLTQAGSEKCLKYHGFTGLLLQCIMSLAAINCRTFTLVLESIRLLSPSCHRLYWPALCPGSNKT